MLNASITEQQAVLVALRQDIIEAIEPFVRERIQFEIESRVKNNPEHTKKLGKETLSEMKKQYVCAVENSSAVCDKIFEDDALWVFVNYKISPDGDQFGQKYNNTKAAKEKIQKGIKMAIGEAGRILVEYKYLFAGREYVWDLGVRYDYSQGSKVESKLMCGYGLTLPQEIMGLIDKYCKEVGQLHELMCQLIDVKNKLSIQEATDLWNEA